MGQVERDGEHIWLRQAVTFTANGQTRTVEMAIPVRPGATAEDIERLLAEAESGMHRLSSSLDGQVAALLNGGVAQATVREPVTPAQAPSLPAPAARPAPAPQTEAPRPVTPPASPQQPAAPARSTAPTPAPVAAHPASRPPAVPSAPAVPPAPPSRARPAGAPASATPDAAELTRKDFLAATTELGLNVKQVMERLHVRTLEGLNLREALEALHRQLVRDGEGAPAPAPAPAKSAASRESPAAGPTYFEEEDSEYAVTFTMDGDDGLAEEFGAYDPPPRSTGSGAASVADESNEPDDLDDVDAVDEFDLDDVPDFGPPPSGGRTAPAPTATPARRAAPRAAPAPEPEPEVFASPADERLAQMRAIRGGGALTPYQRTAYRNVVVNELGEPEAVALVRGIWRVPPERLGAEQLDALVSWGKQDTFAEEANAVIAALRAERQQAAASTTSAPPAAAPRPAPRGRPAQPPQAPPGGR